MSLLKVIDNPDRSQWASMLARPVIQAESLDASVRQILADVKRDGDKAVDQYTTLLDKITVHHRMVEKNELDEAEDKLEGKLKSAILQAKNNITNFHRSQLQAEPAIETQPGIKCWRKSIAIEKVGLYIPGGTAPLFSTLLMLGIPAKLAGCGEIIICTPPQKDGTVHPAILFVAKSLGIHKIFKVGGAQAIAAMAYGTESIPQVYKIFGPGNQYVTHSKKLIQQEGIAIDMPAGPSELAIFADKSAVPEYVAADLLSQCEHGNDSQVILVTDSSEFAEEVNLALELQVLKLPRKSIALKSLGNSKAFLIKSPDEAMDLLNCYAPEHLILSCQDSETMANKVRNAGSVFIGNYAPESAGDYASGTNHTLPTNGYATAYSGVSLDSFLKKITFQQLTFEGLRKVSDAIVEMSNAEGLHGHAAAVEIRLMKSGSDNTIID